MDSLKYLSENFREIISNYHIHKKDRLTGMIGFGAGVVNPLPSSVILGAEIIVHGIPKFKKTTPDIYPHLIKYCKRMGMDETELYKKAMLTKGTFSKIRSMRDSGYKPSKSTILCLCLVLHLSVQEVEEMLKVVGLALSDDMIVDKAVSWSIEHNSYDFVKIQQIIDENGGGEYKLFPAAN